MNTNILAITYLIFLIAIVISTLVDCWKNKDRSIGPKVIWTLLIIITAPTLGIAAVIYAVINFKGRKRFIPLALPVLFIYLFIQGLQSVNKTFNDIQKSLSDYEQEIQKSEEMLKDMDEIHTDAERTKRRLEELKALEAE